MIQAEPGNRSIYLETTSGGSVVIGTLIPRNKDMTPDYDILVDSKTYFAGRPASYTNAWKCR